MTRNAFQLWISIPGKSAPRLAPITCSRGTKWLARPNGTQRGKLFGTFTRAKCFAPVSGSQIWTASESERFEMYGNGWPGSTASGVSTGKTCDSKNSSTDQPFFRREIGHAQQLDAVRVQLGQQMVVETLVLELHQLGDALRDRGELLGGRHAIRGPVLDAGCDLPAKTGDTHHVELVEIRAEDRKELQPLEQRVSRIERFVENTKVEFEPA